MAVLLWGKAAVGAKFGVSWKELELAFHLLCCPVQKEIYTLIYLNARLPNCTGVPINMCFVALFFCNVTHTHASVSFYFHRKEGRGRVLRVRRWGTCVFCLQQSSLPVDV